MRFSSHGSIDPEQVAHAWSARIVFPTACHSGSLLFQGEHRNFVRYDQVSMNTPDRHTTICDFHVYRDAEPTFHHSARISDLPVLLRLKRLVRHVLAAYSEDGGETWQQFPVQPIIHLFDAVQVATACAPVSEPPFERTSPTLLSQSSLHPRRDPDHSIRCSGSTRRDDLPQIQPMLLACGRDINIKRFLVWSLMIHGKFSALGFQTHQFAKLRCEIQSVCH